MTLILVLVVDASIPGSFSGGLSRGLSWGWTSLTNCLCWCCACAVFDDLSFDRHNFIGECLEPVTEIVLVLSVGWSVLLRATFLTLSSCHVDLQDKFLQLRVEGIDHRCQPALHPIFQQFSHLLLHLELHLLD